MLTIDEPKVIASQQNIDFVGVSIKKTQQGVTATVEFFVYDENFNYIETISLFYEGDEYNDFWDNFNSGEFIYEELIAKKGFSVSIPENVEAVFKNPVAPLGGE